MLGDGTIGGEEALSTTRGLEPLHATLALAGGQMGTFTPIVEIATLAVFHPRHSLAFGRPIAFQLVGDDDPRDVR